ncbi:visual pigment-like receptor peropsin [Ptychodera flava]|uniref:visual pigment-like receptor peropsin n=1 Tax=Ptychodera flava TaxID=63121 RepID=UPI00396A9DF9
MHCLSIIVLLAIICSLLNCVPTKLKLRLSFRASETTLSGFSSSLSSVYDSLFLELLSTSNFCFHARTQQTPESLRSEERGRVGKNFALCVEAGIDIMDMNDTATNWSILGTGDQSPSGTEYVVATAILTVICVFGILGNGIVICLFLSFKKLRTPSNAFLVNLAVADFLMASVSFTMSMAAGIEGRWLFGEAGCTFNGFWVTFFGLLSINTMTAIAVERYYVICHHFGTTILIPGKSVGGIMLMLWILTLFWAVAPLTPWNRYVSEGLNISCSVEYTTTSKLHNSYIIALLIGEYAVPLSIITFCYLGIFIKVRSNRLLLSNFTRSGFTRGFKKRLSRECKVARLCVFIFTVYCISWTPYAVVILVCLLRSGCNLPPMVTSLPALFGKASSIYNPLLYAFKHNGIRRVVKRKFKGLKRGVSQSRSTSQSFNRNNNNSFMRFSTKV